MAESVLRLASFPPGQLQLEVASARSGFRLSGLASVSPENHSQGDEMMSHLQDNKSRQWRDVLLSLLLTALAVLPFLPALKNDFISYDDPFYITHNEHVRQGLSWQGVQWAFTSITSANWHPLTMLSHMLDVELFGMNAGAHHAVSLAIHALNALLLWWFLSGATGRRWAAWAVAVVFAVHPLRVESVVWAAERKDVLSTLFWLLTLLSYLGYVRAGGWKRYLLVVVCFVLGLAAKPMLVTLPFVLLLLDAWPLQRIQRLGPSTDAADADGDEGSGTSATLRRRVGRLLLEKVPLFVLLGGSCALTFLVQSEHGAVLDRPWLERLANALVSYVAYLKMMVVPTGLAPFYPYFPPGCTVIILAAAVLAVVTIAAFALRPTMPWLLVGWLWYLGTLVPVIGLVQVGMQARADRYSYIPSIGILLMVFWSVDRLLARYRRRYRLASAVLLLLVVVLGVGSWRQSRYWRDSEVLFLHTLEVTENNVIANHKLGEWREQEGRLPEAEAYYRAAAEACPEFYESQHKLALVLARQEKYRPAEEAFVKAIHLRPGFPDTYYNMGNLLWQQGKLPEAAYHYEFALGMDPTMADARRNLAEVLARMGRSQEAREQFRRLEGESSRPGASQAGGGDGGDGGGRERQ